MELPMTFKIHNSKSQTGANASIKKYGYLMIFVVALLPVVAFAMMKFGSLPNTAAYFPIFFVFIFIPVLDLLLGKDSHNLNEISEVPKYDADTYYPLLPLMCVPIYFLMLSFSMWVFVSADLNFLGKIGWVVSIGIFGSVFAINAAHELMHKNTTIEPLASGFLLSLVCFSGFKVEHIRGHHVHVSTPKDPSSARLGQSLYGFLVQALLHNTLLAFKLEKTRLNKLGKSAWHWQNELIWWHLLSVVWMVISFALFGVQGLAFFLLQSFIAVVFLEIINYVEHYGLSRQLRSNGRYEPVTHKHSWNSNYRFTNLLLFQLQRHSDHHAYPKRRYQILRHHNDSPQLPFGYATMIIIALFPPLWHNVMDPITKRYQYDQSKN